METREVDLSETQSVGGGGWGVLIGLTEGADGGWETGETEQDFWVSSPVG